MLPAYIDSVCSLSRNIKNKKQVRQKAHLQQIVFCIFLYGRSDSATP